ncbi:MAG: hypothetical protein R3E02_14160 [Blastomonas sp.]
MKKSVDLFSPLSPEAMARKLKSIMDDDMPGRDARVIGNGTQYDMTLRYARRGQFNSFAPQLKAKMKEERGGTRITGKLGRPAGSYVFMIFWFGFLSLFLFVGAGVGLSGGPEAWMFSAIFMGVPLFMMVIGALIFGLGLKGGKEDPEHILAFLEKELQAKDRKDPGYKVY